MEEIVIADSDVIIDYFNGINPSAEIIDRLIREQTLGLTTISVFELLAGILGKKRLKAVELLLKQSKIIPVDTKSAKESARVYTTLKSRGSLIGNQDILIAGVCLAHGFPLFTRNRSEFERVPHLSFYQG